MNAPHTPLTVTFNRIRAAADAGQDWPAAELSDLLDAIASVELSSQAAINDSAEARIELSRRLGVLDALSALPPETLRGWRFAATSALDLHRQGSLSLDPQLALETILKCLDEIDRLVAELGRREGFLTELEARVAAATEGIRALQLRNGVEPLPPFVPPTAALDAIEHLEPEPPATSEHVALPGHPDVMIAREIFEQGNVIVDGVKVSATEPDNDAPKLDAIEHLEPEPPATEHDAVPGDLDWEGPGPDDFSHTAEASTAD